MHTPLSFHRYGGRNDLPDLLAFTSQVVSARRPLRSTWHPGDLIWQLRGHFDHRPALYAVRADVDIVGVAWFQGPGELLLELHPAHERRATEVLDWAVGRLRPGDPELSVVAFDADLARRAALERCGFVRAGPDGVLFERATSDAPPVLPDGFRVRDSVGVDPDARSAVHRAAWSALGHLGIEGGPSGFTTEVYRSLLETPGYDPEFDLLIEAPDGALAANAIVWRDAACGVGIFEPMGTDPAYRGHGLAGALITEGLRRLHAAGIPVATIGTAHFNAPARKAYAREFALVDTSSRWVRPPIT
ncbi:GNAT family N-acetyltransferase [uncultured Phenylobacterium sp.]|uniref:GNAT family N-acetyltransferase n=1 Tax=uncultured Phenylobacterium sp. TaxID=349273 RepID=UPI0025CC7C28|nr:GNAT family N-acetyltransferase [uncultured Phenylobacterium sp.]